MAQTINNLHRTYQAAGAVHRVVPAVMACPGEKKKKIWKRNKNSM